MLLIPFRRIAISTLTFTAVSATSATAANLTGAVTVDGSSTVYPISEAVAEEFQKANPKVRVTVGTSGTGGGFKKFTTGEIAISAASRPIKSEEAEKAKANKIDYIELAIAIDGLSVVVNAQSKLTTITTAQLKQIWEPKSKVSNWSDVDKSWPATKIKLYGPGPDSGTFDYFTEAIVGKAKESRADYTASEDDNVLVRGISQDVNGLGYFGYEYYAANQKKQKTIKALAIDAGKGAIAPSTKTIEDGTYPLSRPLFIYVSRAGATKPEVAAFVNFYLSHASRLSKEVGAVALPASRYKDETAKWNAWLAGKTVTAKADAKDTRAPAKATEKKKK